MSATPEARRTEIMIRMYFRTRHWPFDTAAPAETERMWRETEAKIARELDSELAAAPLLSTPGRGR